MWGPIPAVAILMAAVPASVLSAGFQFARTGSSQVDYRRAYCVSFLEKGDARPFIAKHCMPGSTFKLGCNRCLCRKSGKTAICTKKNCYQRIHGSACAPGTARTLECNICICSPTGRWACTQRHCRPGIRHVPCNRDMSATPSAGTGPQQCVPGSSFMNGCDRCYCANDGVSAVCRSRPCNGVTGTLVPLGSVSDGSQTQYPGCGHAGPGQMSGEDEGTTFQNATHICYICGDMTVCYEIVIPDGATPPTGGGGSDDDDDWGWAPLRRPETSAADPAKMAGGVGTGGDLRDSGYKPGKPDFQNETHVCFIYEGAATVICIHRRTIEAGPAKMAGGVGTGGVPRDSGYQPGQPDFQNETHVCFIYEGAGTVICIHRRTIEDGRAVGDDSSITPTSLYRNETHHCIIYQGVPSCNELHRLPGSWKRKEQVCTPFTVWYDGCNWCTCNHDGTSYGCTLVYCEWIREYDCTPGTTFMDKCYVCTCRPDGKTATCTMKHYCPPGSY